MEGITTPRIALIAVVLPCEWLCLRNPFEKRCENQADLFVFVTPAMVYTHRCAQSVVGPISSASARPMAITVLLFLYIVGDGHTHLPLQSSTRRLYSQGKG